MKKNFTLTNALLLLPLIASSSLLSMELVIANDKKNIVEENKKNPLEESMMMPIIPTTRGLGILRSAKDWVWHEEENIYDELVKKELDLNNSSYHRKIDTTIEIYSSTRKNSDKLASVLSLCRKEPYNGKIKINDTQASMAHIFLTQQNHTQQSTLKKTIETNDQNFINKYNILLEDLQTIFTDKVESLNDLLNTHIKERSTIVQEKGNEVRELKKALVNLHHLNKTFKLPEDKKSDGYCSDEEKNADNVSISYNDEHLLQKNNIAYSMSQTKKNIEKTLNQLYVLNTKLFEIEPVVYTIT